MKRAAEIIGKIVLVFLLAFIITIVLMIPVILLAVYSLSKGSQTGQAFADWDTAALLSHVWADPTFFYGSTIAQAIGFIAASIILYSWLERKRDPGWSMGWRSKNWLPQISGGLVLGTVLILVAALLMNVFGAVHLRIRPADSIEWVALGGYIVFMAVISLNEEVLIRGYTQGLLRYHFGIWPAMIVSSMLFALMHGLNPGALDHPLPLINAALAGLLLAVCRETSGGLWYPFGVHLSWNYVQGSILGFEVSGTSVPSLLRLERSGAPLLHGDTFGAEGSILTLFVIITATAAIWHLQKIRASG